MCYVTRHDVNFSVLDAERHPLAAWVVLVWNISALIGAVAGFYGAVTVDGVWGSAAVPSVGKS